MTKWFFVTLAFLLSIFSVSSVIAEGEQEQKNQNQNIEEHILKVKVPLKAEEERKKFDISGKTVGDLIFGKEIEILVTGYSSTVDQCDGNPFITASGSRVHLGTMACPPEYAFGTVLKIEGKMFICEDRGGKIKGNHFDRWFETRGEALAWGKRTVKARIIM